MKQTYICGFILMAVFRTSSLDAATNEPSMSLPAATLNRLVADALERNPELRFYEAEVIAAKAGRKSAGLLTNPEVSGSLGQKAVRGSGLSCGRSRLVCFGYAAV